MRLCQYLLSVVLLLLPAAAHSAAAPFSTINLHHTSWTAKDGAPPSIIAIAQTPDRWMWLASQNGLYRFDGVRFERFKPPNNASIGSNIWGMRVLEDGSLWIGYRTGGASVWHNGTLRTYGTADGFPSASVLDFAQDWKGRIWASTSVGFRVFDGQRWQPADESQSGKTGQCFLLTDAAKTIWARCEPGVLTLARGASAFGAVKYGIGFGRISVAKDGTVWATGGKANELLALDGPRKDQPLPDWPRAREGGGAMLFERDGVHAWLTRSDGVMRVGPDSSGKPFGISSGMSGDIPNCLYQDVEGNVWVGTENGLDRFREAALSSLSVTPVYWDTEAIAAGDGGAIWVGGNEVRSPGYDTLAALPGQAEGTAVSAVYKYGADVWTGGRDGLWHYHEGGRENIPLPDYLTTRQFYLVFHDNDGGLWVSVRGTGVIRLKHGEWQRGAGYPELERRASWIMQDKRGRLLFGYMDNSIRVLENGAIKTYGSHEGLAAGTVQQIIETEHGYWVGGLNGLFHFDGAHFVQVLGSADDAFQGISGLVEYGGALWLNGSAGVTRIEQQELAKALARPGYRMAFRRYDYRDGLRGSATTSFPVPSAVVGTDGKLWFTTTAGLFWLDTSSESKNPMPPPVFIQHVTTDGVEYPLSAQLTTQLPANPGRVEIAFTALSLTLPERMQFQYRLEGVDHDWQSGGATRTAIYTGLDPGDYQFRVRASNNDGVWSTADAVASISVQPAYYQTVWFRLAAALVLMSLLWLAHRLRVAHVAGQVAVRIEARMQERERIARDLHDTLLQSVQGLLLQLQSMVCRISPGDPRRADLEHSLDLVQASLEEGRDKVQDLRCAPAVNLEEDVKTALLAEYPALPLSSHTSGNIMALKPHIYQEVRAISIEALRNAASHAQATSIIYEVCYTRNALEVTIRDNGVGLSQVSRDAAPASGHWGLLGMRERAAAVHATLTLEPAPHKGLEVRLSISASLAYLH